jgi:hypothetical protein
LDDQHTLGLLSIYGDWLWDTLLPGWRYLPKG